MRNITERFRRVRTIEWGQFFAIVLFLLVIGISPALAAALGPIDGDGLVPTDLERVKVGDPAPDFSLEDENGKPVTLSQFHGKNSVILVFYRGHW